MTYYDYRVTKERLTDLLGHPLTTPVAELFEIAADALERKDRLIAALSDDLKRERDGDSNTGVPGLRSFT